MRLIVIERFNPDYPTIVTNEDGEPKIFDNYPDAWNEAADCQDGLVVQI